MNDKRYAIVGWLAIASAVMMLPTIFLGILLDVLRKPPVLLLLGPYLLFSIASTAFSLYALYRLRGLLNDRFQFHEVDGLIVAIIFCVIALTSVAMSGKLGAVLAKAAGVREAALLPFALIFLGLLVLCGVATSILSTVFAVKLLRLQDDLFGLLKPYAYATMAAAVCFATVILAPVGLFIDAAATVMLGIIFLRAARGLPAPEFV